jgi:hypothetical protein
LLDILISRGCFIDEPDNEGTTLLMLAAQNTYMWLITAALERGADPNLRDSKGRTALHYSLLDAEKRGYRENLDNEPISSLLAAGAQPAITDNKKDSALSIAIHLSEKYIGMRNLLDMMLQNANDDEIKTAKAMAAKMATKKTLGNLGNALLKILPSIIVVLIIGGLSIGMRKGVYKNNPAENWMGPINAVLIITAVVAAGAFGLGFLILGNLVILLIFMAGFWVVCLFIGIILTSALSPIRKAFYNNALLYYLPTAISVVVAICFIVNLMN